MVLEVLFPILAGVGIGLSLTAPPGPVNALIASHTVTRSWRAGFLVGVGATAADTIFLILSVLARSTIVGIEPYVPFIALLGAAIMGFFARNAIVAWREPERAIATSVGASAKSFATGLGVNITSPYPILWWLTAGLVFLNQLGPAVLVGFYGGLILWITTFPFAIGKAQRRYPRTYQAVLVFSIVLLVAFATWLVLYAVAALLQLPFLGQGR